MRALALVSLVVSAGCGGEQPLPRTHLPRRDDHGQEHAMPEKIPPPPPGTPRDVRFPAIQTKTLANGLDVDVVGYHALPVLYLQLVVRSGSIHDPADVPGLASAVAQMLKEGTRSRSSKEIAEAVEFVGGDLSTDADQETLTIRYRVLKEHAETALELLSDLVRNPSFPEAEIRKLKKRELDRLSVSVTDPNWLATREFYKALYGTHPYAVFDATPVSIAKVNRPKLVAFHHEHVVASNAHLIAVGDVDPDAFFGQAEHAFAGWTRGHAPEKNLPAVAPPEARKVVVVDRPRSVQTQIYIGELTLRRRDDDYIPLRVANQVLGGNASARLFLDLRERRSLTYGAYSRVEELPDVSPWRASAAVRSEVTDRALDAFFENFRRWRDEPASEEELGNAKTFLTGVFPILIETPANVADMVASLRELSLPRDYWDTYRSRIAAVTADQAVAAARRYVDPDKTIVVLVGEATRIEPIAARWGPVTVVSAEDGAVVRNVPAAAR
jgi:zinc protease